MSSDRNYEDDLDTSLSAIDVEGKIFTFIKVQENKYY